MKKERLNNLNVLNAGDDTAMLLDRSTLDQSLLDPSAVRTFSTHSESRPTESVRTESTRIDVQRKIRNQDAEKSTAREINARRINARRIKVCYMIDRLNLAGTENHLLSLIRELDRNRFEPMLVLLNGSSPVSQSLEPQDCATQRLGISSFLHPSTLFRLIRFARWLRSERVDVLQLYFPDSTLFGVVAGWLGGVRKIIRTRRNSGYWMTRWHRFRSRFIGRFVAATVVNSRASAESLIEQVGAAKDSIRLIPNGVDLERFKSVSDESGNNDPVLKGADGKIRIGMLTNLRPVKRIDTLIRAVALVVDAHAELVVEIAGEGPQRPELQTLINHLGLEEHVTLNGSVADVPAFLQRLSMLVCCSESEGLSNSLMEAMAGGLPLIATDIPGNRELIVHQETGLLFAVNDETGLAESMVRLIEDPELAARLGRHAQQFVSKNHDKRKTIRQYEELYCRLTAEKTSSGPVESSRNISFKSLIKALLYSLAVLLTLPLWLLTRLTGSEQVFLSSAQFLSLIPGLSGVFLRRGFYSLVLESCSRDCHIEFGTWFSHRAVRVGRRVYIGARCTIGMAQIGDDVLIGSNVDILSGKNQHRTDDLQAPINSQGGRFTSMSIGRNCWIGNSSVIIDDIGPGSIVGAGSVVTKPVPEMVIAAGNPARVIRQREVSNDC